jgi:uncharacterized beta-barrel protein YwiB (DUF1934 family)
LIEIILFFPCRIKIEESLVNVVEENDCVKAQTFLKVDGMSKEFVRKNEVKVTPMFNRNVLTQTFVVQSVINTLTSVEDLNICHNFLLCV